MLTVIKNRVPIFNFALVIAIQSFIMGMYLALFPEEFTAKAYKPLFTLAPKALFAYYLIIVGLVLFQAWHKMSLAICRIGLVLFGIYFATEGAGYLTSYIANDVSLWPVIKDFSMTALCGVGAFSTFPYRGVK